MKVSFIILMLMLAYGCRNKNDCAGVAKDLFAENVANEKEYEKGNIEEAIQLTSEVINSNPNNFIAYSNRAAFHYKKQIALNELSPIMKDSIFDDLYYSISLCSQFEKAYKNIIQIAYDLDDFETVEHYGAQYKSIFKPNCRIFTIVGDALFSLKKFNQAIPYLDSALSITPIDTSAYWVRGRCYRALGRTEQAIKDFDTAINLDSTQVLAFHERAVTYKRLKRYDEAQDDYLKAIQLDSTRSETYFSMGNLCLDTGDPVLACLYYRKALKVTNLNNKIAPNIDKEALLSTIEKYCK